MRAAGIVTCSTDFGLDDSYAAQMHGALLSIAPSLRIVDISHAIPPGDADAALFLTESAWPYFPPGTVHLVVVDPGVGSDRGLVAIETPDGWLVGPDTGVLSSGLPAQIRPAEGSARASLPDGHRAVDIRHSPLATGPVSRTFHGRDLMAPIAASLAICRPLTDAGPTVSQITAAASLATPVSDGRGAGRILHVDRFGNAITSFRAAEVDGAFTITVQSASGHAWRIDGPSTQYMSPSGGAIALPSSSGYLEIAVPSGSAAKTLGIERGDRTTIGPRETGGHCVASGRADDGG
jgi:S-adenosylmethionine hydrolase